MIIQPKIRGFICTTAHPLGCEKNVENQIAYVKKNAKFQNKPQNVLVVGASTGYGLASRIAAAWGAGSGTVGVFFEKPADEVRTGSAGWYNTMAFDKAAKRDGIYSYGINGDAFSDEIKLLTAEVIARDMGKIDTFIYSLASPRRVDPVSGEIYKSALKTVGESYTCKTLNTDKREIYDVTIAPAEGDELTQTAKVMGGEDWERWIRMLLDAGVLADGLMTMAYSYIGPRITYPIYREGTIGKAKEHIESTVPKVNGMLESIKGRAYISVNKALVTQASSAIPVVPLYITVLYRIMKKKGIHEGCIEQMTRLFNDFVCKPGAPKLDEKGRIRIDDWELRADVQAEVEEVWAKISTENLPELSDIDGYQSEFLNLFGFNVDGIDYEADVELS